MRKALAWVLAAGLVLTGSPATAAEEQGPEEIIRGATERVLDALREHEGEPEPQELYDLVREEVVPHINMKLVTRFAMGQHWNAASSEQRRAIAEELTTLLIRTYSEPLLEYDDEEVVYGSARVDEERGRASMSMEVEQSDGPAIPVTYQFRKREDDPWQVFDVSVEGVSLVTSYRDNFNSEIRRNGVEGLLEKLRERNDQGETGL